MGGLRSPLRGFFEALAVAVPLLFLALAMGAAVEFAVDEAIVITAALDISAAWRVSALPVGFGLMLVLALLRLAGQAEWRATLAAVVLVVATAAAFSALHPYFAGLGNLNLVIFFVGLVGAMVLAGIPIAFATATFGYICLTTRLPHTVVIGRMDEGMSYFVLLSVPLFVFLGMLIEMTGMARAMVGFLASLLGHMRGGLQYVLVGAMYLVSGISGSKAADMAAIAPVLLPEMEKRGAQRGELLALLSATGAQTETIPPSLVLITVGSVTGVSIAALFAGGLLPAVVHGALLCAVVWWRSRGEDLSAVRRASLREIASAFVVALPALALPFIIRAAVIEGVATATEVSTIGVAYAALAGLLIYRRFDWKRLYPMLVDTAALSGAILLIIGAATAMAWALTQSGFSASLAKMMMALPGGPFAFLLVSLLAFVVLGSVLEGIPAIVLFGLLLFPIARQVGLHEAHHAMVVILAMGIGLFAPPFGVGYYAACAISRISPDEGMGPMLGYMAALFIGTLIVAAVPWISTGFL
ncbi:TRAP transporter large permease [Xanthobacter oligotrophicus]|uniref:TRAP transporter large permease protein n=1 Tax=Xanthobacter oligotrophicus TaxID=2607286 RepID=A0ABW7A1Q4_9HYPH